MKLIIDRIESGIAVCELLGKRKIINIPMELIEKGAKEGDVINIEIGKIDFQETDKRKKDINKLTEDMWK